MTNFLPGELSVQVHQKLRPLLQTLLSLLVCSNVCRQSSSVTGSLMPLNCVFTLFRFWSERYTLYPYYIEKGGQKIFSRRGKLSYTMNTLLHYIQKHLLGSSSATATNTRTFLPTKLECIAAKGHLTRGCTWVAWACGALKHVHIEALGRSPPCETPLLQIIEVGGTRLRNRKGGVGRGREG